MGALILVDPSLSVRDSDDDGSTTRISWTLLGWVLLLISLFVSVASAALQAMYGASQQEVEHSMLEHAAREADLALSTRELTADNEKLRKPYGDTDLMTLEEKGSLDIRKYSFMRAMMDVKWSVPTAAEHVAPLSSKSLAYKFTSGRYPCYGAWNDWLSGMYQ